MKLKLAVTPTKCIETRIELGIPMNLMSLPFIHSGSDDYYIYIGSEEILMALTDKRIVKN